jgi:hypothetical protein
MIYGNAILDTTACSDFFTSNLSAWTVSNAVWEQGAVILPGGSLTWPTPVANFDVDVVCSEGVQLRWNGLVLDLDGLLVNGIFYASRAIPGPRHRLRFLKWGTMLHVYVDQRLIALIDVADVTSAYSLAGEGKVFSVERHPIILFGDVPGLVTMHQGSAVVVAPPSELPGTVTVTGYGCSGSAVLGTFYFEPTGVDIRGGTAQ